MTVLISMLVGCVCVAGPVLTVTVPLAEGWHFRADPQGTGLAHGWADADYDDRAWPSIAVGRRWEDQGYPNLDGYGWYRVRVAVPAGWKDRPVWLVLGGANDACTVFCNGKQIHSYGGVKGTVSVARTSLIADLTSAIQAGHANVLAVRVFDWGNSGGLSTPVAKLTCDPMQLPLTSVFLTSLDWAARAVDVAADLTGLGNETPGLELTGVLFASGSRIPLARRSVTVQKSTSSTGFALPVPNVVAGTSYCVHVTLNTARGDRYAHLVADLPVVCPRPRSWPGKYASLRVRNNFVTQLLRATIATGAQRPFLNPRAGWVFFAVTAGKGRQARLYVDGARQPLAWRREPRTGALEAMQYMKEGRHQVRLEADSPWTCDIRAVPELAYCYYRANPLLAEQGRYDLSFLARHVLRHVNTLVASSKPPAAEFQQWLREGRHWVSNAGLPGLGSRTPPTADVVFQAWARNPGVTQSGYAGLIVDEFGSESAGHYRVWSDALRRLHALPGFRGRTFYAWCGSLFRQPHGLHFSNLLIDRNDRLCWERYLDEEPTLRGARVAITREIVQPAAAWKEKTPNLLAHLTVCLGYLSAPPESLNTNPGVNYHVFKDMQIHRLATDPTFWGLSGLMDYSASYADEEALRWTHRMFRHYCIEGSREPLVQSPYILPHLANPDFAAGTTAWQVEAAAPGSVRPGTMDGFSWLEGRYPRTKAGDQFLVLTRSVKKPNTVRQQMRKLIPGRLYSLKLIAADLGTLDRKQQLALAVGIGRARTINKYSFRSVYPSNYAHRFGPYNAGHPAYFNFFRIVFRPAKTECMLTISDWTAAGSAGGPAGQKIALNFVEVQPFLAPE